MIKKWTVEKVSEVFKSHPFNVLEKHYKKPDNQGNFTGYVLKIPNWVNIIAYNEKNEILLIRQFRFGTDEIALEIPGGVIDQGEEPLKAAMRELKEETGYEGKNWKQIGVVDANPAIQTNKCYTFVAELASKGDTNFDPDEIIEMELASMGKTNQYIKNGKITNAYIIAAFHWFDLFKSKK